MKSRKLIFRAAALLLVLALGAWMMVIGRGHTVYLDNKKLEYEGETYKAPYKVVIKVDGEQVGKLYDKERAMSICIGQSFTMTLEVTEEKGGDETIRTVSMTLPYNMDGIVLNLPGILNGLPQEAYLSEFVSLATETSGEDEEVVTDEFAMGDI